MDAEKDVATAGDALAGARDIIAERVADDANLRGQVRKIYEEEATVSSKIMYGKEEENDAVKYRDYFEWSELFKSIHPPTACSPSAGARRRPSSSCV